MMDVVASTQFTHDHEIFKKKVSQIIITNSVGGKLELGPSNN
jgi:hypothetical protein